MQEDGAPGVVQRTLIAPPRSRLGPVDAKERAIIQSISPCEGKYDTAVDRESAEEILAARGEAAAAAAQAAKAKAEADKAAAAQAKVEAKQREQELKEQARRDAAAAREAAKPSGFDKAVQSATRSAASSVGRRSPMNWDAPCSADRAANPRAAALPVSWCAAYWVACSNKDRPVRMNRGRSIMSGPLLSATG